MRQEEAYLEVGMLTRTCANYEFSAKQTKGDQTHSYPPSPHPRLYSLLRRKNNVEDLIKRMCIQRPVTRASSVVECPIRS